MPRRYRIYLLSAQSILSYAKEEGGAVTIALNRDATRRCQLPGRQEQEENALFFQIHTRTRWKPAPLRSPKRVLSATAAAR